MRKFEVRFRVPWTDAEQYAHGFKFRVVKAIDAQAARESLPFNSFDIHVTEVPTNG